MCRHGNWPRIRGIPQKRIAFSAGKKLTREKKIPGIFFSRGVKLIFRRSEATYLPQHRFRILLCACAVAPLPLWLQAQSVNMASMSRIVQRGESFDESCVANPWNWNWVSATIEVECGDAVKTERVGTRFRKLTLAGHAWCIVCDKQLSYGSRGLATLTEHLGRKSHLKNCTYHHHCQFINLSFSFFFFLEFPKQLLGVIMICFFSVFFFFQSSCYCGIMHTKFVSGGIKISMKNAKFSQFPGGFATLDPPPPLHQGVAPGPHRGLGGPWIPASFQIF